jgi:hypothetical protein
MLSRFLRWLGRDIQAALSLGFLVLLAIVAVAAPWIAPHSPIGSWHPPGRAIRSGRTTSAGTS